MPTERNPSSFSLSLSLVFSLLAAFGLFMLAASCGVLGLVQVMSNQGASGLAELFILVLGTAWCALLLLPGAWLAFQRLQGQKPASPEPPPAKRWAGRLPALLLIVYPLVLVIGSQIARYPGMAWMALPPLQILAATLPVFWLAGLALRKLQAGSWLRRWSVFGWGLVLAPALIMVLELSAILVIILALVVVFSSDQSRVMELTLLVQRLQYAESDPQAILRLLRPFLLQPGVLFGAFAFMAAFVPLVEELLKPLGVWLLAGTGLSPVQGFTAGVLSGAGYALFENLFITAPGEAWALVSLGRIGTTTMHIFTTGITGYALASAWGQRRYLRLGGLFLLSVLIHALWNSLTLLSLAGTLHASLPGGTWATWLGQAVLVGLMVLYLALFAALVMTNRRLRSYAIIPALAAQAAGEAPVLSDPAAHAETPT